MIPPPNFTLDDEMFSVVYDELRRLAYGLTRGCDSPTLNPTALVHEAYIKLSRASRFRAESPQHLKFAVVRAMRHILIDAARRRSAAIRGGPHTALHRVTLDEAAAQSAFVDPSEILGVDLALRELAREHELPARAFELQFFGGLQIGEVADLMGVSEKKVQRLSRLAKAKLARRSTIAPASRGSPPHERARQPAHRRSVRAARRRAVVQTAGAARVGPRARSATGRRGRGPPEADVDRHPVLEQDIATLADGLLDIDGASRMPPRIGAYVLERHLGEGGMGSVYLARRDGLGDLVALKLLRDPWSSPAQRRRFASEQLLLAALNHRYIARLYDAGVTGDTPWFAMEYVSGPSLVEHCRQRGATLRERLALFRAACEAVSYAHRNLTVHLDLKPSNMLVNAEGDVKLVDFGVARHLSADGAADKTSTLNRWLSLNYAAPEQIRGETVDVQADVYSLGVILYELLVGVRPADLTRLSAAELAERLQEEPPLPSTSARNGPGAVQASKAEWRDLDALCSMAMRRDKATRYPTVDALIADVDHFLRDEPLAAQRTRASAYRLRKFLIRHRRPLAASAAAATLVAVLIASFTVQLIDARNTAVSSEARMQRIHQLMLNLFEGDDQAAGPAEGLRVVTLLDRGVREAESLDRDPDLQAELRYTFGILYLKLGHVTQAEPLLTSAWTARQALFGADHELTIRAQQGLAELRIEQSRMDEAEQLARSSLETAERRFADDSRQVAIARAVAGKVLAANGDYEGALGLLEPAVTVLSQGPASVELSEALGDLANTHYYLGHVDVSEQVNRRALPLDQELFGDRHPYVAVTLYNLGNIRLDYGDYAEGERLFARAAELNESWYGATHPKTATSVLMLGRSIAYQGRLSEADALYRRALEALRAAYGENHVRVGGVLSLMGDLARDQGQFAEAERLFAGAAAVFKNVTGDNHEFYVHQRSNLGSVRLAQHQYAEAERELRPAVDQLSAQLPEHRYTALAQIRLGTALSHLERYEEAERHAAAGYRTLRRLAGSSAGELQDAARLLEEIDQALGRPEKARELAADDPR